MPRSSLWPRAASLLAPFLVAGLATPWLTGRASGTQTGTPTGTPAQEDGELIAEGRELYETGCAGCHGTDGSGVTTPDGEVRGPSLLESGEAGAYFFLATGRMPLASGEGPARRKPPAYDDQEITALVAYVASLGDGPALPDVDPDRAVGDGTGLARGGELYRQDCQACHGASGAGGALSYGHAAPSLGSATPEEVAAAVRIGPGQMPTFGTDVVPDEELDELVAYVRYLHNPEDPGGLPIGRTGPIPEGFVAWLVGLGALLGLVAWIGTRELIRPRRESHEGREGEVA